MHLFTIFSFKAHDAEAVIALYFERVQLLRFCSGYAHDGFYRCESKWFIAVDHEEILRVWHTSSGVTGAVADDLILFGDDLDVRAPIISTHHKKRAVRFRESKPELRRAFGGR